MYTSFLSQLQKDLYLQKKNTSELSILKKSDREQLRVDYYKRGGKAAETKYQDSLRHQNSESYYPSGERFRSALYYKDSLLKDLYFFKNGDTIKNFPHVTPDKVYHLKLLSPDSQIVSFDYFDGKILPDSYKRAE
ncbi:hypothetical protein LVD15_26740 [Fulvivirga maritima]|uniref:hypothetical protein n=1 Tax=Fulvivirga maritima TaxID=2904247 RepID=UPI001F2B1369|nr:hypothetical protein [Fulvivirga maritima]UII26847.1 hypothetical protein LVD15_26740 [Fulvivirga maritima]